MNKNYVSFAAFILIAMLVAFRTISPSEPLTGSERLSVGLYDVNADGTLKPDDGALTIYNDNYSDTVNVVEDAYKLTGTGVSIAILRDGHKLAIERRKIIGITDTSYYTLGGLQQKTYALQFIALNLNHPGLAGFVLDSFMHTRTPLKLNDTTTIQFTVTANSLSALARRFTVLFVPIEAAPVPVTFTGINAKQQSNNNISLQWNVANQLDVKQYQVQKSCDGNFFNIVYTTEALGNSGTSFTYNWIDTKITTANNYYRIASIDRNGSINYSHTVNVKSVLTSGDIAIYPNPVKDRIINIKFTNKPAGLYRVQLVNTMGQTVLTSALHYAGDNIIQALQTEELLPKGIYVLNILAPDNTTTTMRVTIL